MKIELQPCYNINFCIGEFLNVDLIERGYHQIRVRAIKQSCIESIEIADSSEDTPRFQREPGVLPATIINDVGVSKSVEVTYVSENKNIDNIFTIAVKLNPTNVVDEVTILDIEIELLRLDRFTDPSYELFEKIDKRTIQVPLDPTRLIAGARPIYFDISNYGCLTIRIFSTLVEIDTKRKRHAIGIAQTNEMAQSPKLRSLYSSAVHSLLFTTRSLQTFIQRYSPLVPSIIQMECIDINAEKQEALQRFETSNEPLSCIENDLSDWSGRTTIIYQQLLTLFQSSDEVHTQLLLSFDKQRMKIISESFWFNERPMESLLTANDLIPSETFQTVIRSQYMRQLPKVTLFCPETDQDGDKCPVVFEECYTTAVATPNSESGVQSEDIEILGEGLDHASILRQITKGRSVSSSRSASSSRSLRDFFRSDGTKSFRFMSKRRRSSQNSPALVRRQSENSERPKTLTGDDNVKLDNVVVDSKDPSPDEPSSSRSAVSQSATSQSSSERCSAAGEGRSDRPNDLGQVAHICKDARHLFEAPETHPRDMITTFEFLKTREEIKNILVNERGYEGFLYSEKASFSIHHPVSAPLKSRYVERFVVKPSPHYVRVLDEPVHLIVFVHGLDGNHDDLAPYRVWLKHAIYGYYQSKRLDEGTDVGNSWRLEFLMSRANLGDTWTDFDSMAINLLQEIKEFVKKYEGFIKRISFVGHSLGGIIARAAVGLAPKEDMVWMVDILYTILTINTPHLGIGYSSKHIQFGAKIIKWWKKSRSMEQLTMRDSVKFKDTYIYNLSGNEAFAYFRNVVLIGSPDDTFVPYTTSLLEQSKVSTRDPSAFGESYREMLANLLGSVRKSVFTKNFVRYTSVHQLEMSNTNRIMGRGAHIAAMEDMLFIEKLCCVSAFKYFV